MFTDRRDAGRQLAEKLKHYEKRKEVLILALPRGGVLPGFEIARAIGAPLDVLIVRKIGFAKLTSSFNLCLWNNIYFRRLSDSLFLMR